MASVRNSTSTSNNCIKVGRTITEAEGNGNGNEHQDDDGSSYAADATPAVEPYLTAPTQGLH